MLLLGWRLVRFEQFSVQMKSIEEEGKCNNDWLHKHNGEPKCWKQGNINLKWPNQIQMKKIEKIHDISILWLPKKN